MEEQEQQWFDGDYYGKCYDEELNRRFGVDGRAKNSAAIRRKGNRKPFEGEIISTAKIERKMNKYLADEEEGRRRLAEAKIRCAASADLIAKALAPRRNTDPIERLKQFSVDLMKRDQREAKKSKNRNLNDVMRGFQLHNFYDAEEKLETLQDPYDSTRGLKYRSRAAFGDVNFNRALELKQLLEQRERYFNGEMDEVYYKIGPDGNSMPKPPNVRIKSARSTASSRQTTAISSATENLDSISKQIKHQRVVLKNKDILEQDELSDGVDYLSDKYTMPTSSESLINQLQKTFQTERRQLLNSRESIALNADFEKLKMTSEGDLALDNHSMIKSGEGRLINQIISNQIANKQDFVDKKPKIKSPNSKSEPVMAQNSAMDIISYEKQKIAYKRATMKMPSHLNASAWGIKSIKNKKSKPKQTLDRKSGQF